MASFPTRYSGATSPARWWRWSRTARCSSRRAMATPTSNGRSRSIPTCTLFRPGSVSKLFTWTAVMQLVEQGKLDLDKDVNTYLDFKIPAGLRQADHPAERHDPHAGIRGGRPQPLLRRHHQGAAELATWLKDWTPDRGSTRREGARVLQLRHGPGRVHRPAGVGRAVRAVHRAPHLPAARHGARDLPPAAAGVTPQGHVRGLREASAGEPKPFEMVVGAPAGALSASGADMGAIHDRPPAERPLRRGQHPSARRRPG